MCIKHFYWPHLTVLRTKRGTINTEVGWLAQGDKLAKSEGAASSTVCGPLLLVLTEKPVC